MLISEEELARHRAHGTWRMLEAKAQTLCADVRARGGAFFSPRLGGGTRLMLALNHRMSDDIDLFVDSPAWLPYVSPRLNDATGAYSYREESDFVKLAYDQGEIDFIAASRLLDDAGTMWNPGADETLFELEPPAEILAKKLFFRGWALAPRDLFDWFCLARNATTEAIPHRQLARVLNPRIESLRKAIERLNPRNATAAAAWDAIRTPFPIELDSATRWANEEIQRYETLA